jgi:hypothetical protein
MSIGLFIWALFWALVIVFGADYVRKHLKWKQ